ncbi:hypothetical protein F5Y14DRAFT_224104 [Nemania sp. NC0429]|nr:hypothetical protein F5Y14DRAFT_224104 [Nemania sp. NC0429]
MRGCVYYAGLAYCIICAALCFASLPFGGSAWYGSRDYSLFSGMFAFSAEALHRCSTHCQHQPQPPISTLESGGDLRQGPRSAAHALACGPLELIHYVCRWWKSLELERICCPLHRPQKGLRGCKEGISSDTTGGATRCSSHGVM